MGWKWALAQKLEIRWWQGYLKHKNVANYLSDKKAYWQRVLQAVELRVPTGSKVLDAGCGPAGLFMILPDCQVVAVDPLLDRYQTDLVHFEAAAYPWTSFQNKTIEGLEDAAEFDFLFCLNVINHVDNIAHAMDALVKAAKPGATFVLSIDTHRSPLLKKVFQTIPGDVLHPHQYDLHDYQRMLEKRGCTVKRKQLLKPGLIFDYWILVTECP